MMYCYTGGSLHTENSDEVSQSMPKMAGSKRTIKLIMMLDAFLTL